MRLISRTIFREIFVTAILGAALFTFVLFLQQAGRLFEFLVRTSGPPKTVAYLFAMVVPVMLPFAIPLGVLIGTLVTLSRMSTDGEITAMRAAGVPGRRVVPAILMFGFLAMCCAAAASLWLTPWSIREEIRVKNILIASELTADVQARVFEEQFPNKVLYVGDVTIGPPSRWRQIFVADVTPPGERAPSASERGDNPSITLAPEAIAVPDPSANRLQLSLKNGSTYEPGKDAGDYHISEYSGQRGLNAEKPKEATLSRPVTQMDTRPLYRLAYRTRDLDKTSKLDAQIELNERFALPWACILLSLAGVPLGITTRRAGKSGAVVLTVALALIYWIGLGTLVSLSRQGKLSPALAVWLPDILFAIFGIAMLTRLEKPRDRDIIGSILSFFRGLGRVPQQQPRVQRALDRQAAKIMMGRFPLVPQIIDRYVLTSFLFYFAMLVITFVAIFHIFEFFQLLSDIIRNGIGLNTILSYHFFLTPRLIYDFTPIGVLAAILVVFAILTKHNEITAFKACGISAHRLTIPILVACLGLSAGLFAFDYFWVPEADRRQDQLRSVIKGKAPQTYLHPERKWINTEHNRVYYYEYFDPSTRVMSGVNVYEIDPGLFRLKRHIFAKRARWEPTLNKWEFQSGWCADIRGTALTGYDNFPDGIRTFKELEEGPDYFMREAHQSRQMNFQELETYIADLQTKGFDTISLQVQLNKKFSVPMFAFIMAMVSIPFAFLAGNRGAMAGVGVSLALAIAYWSVDKLFEQVGALGQLPPEMAAWSPDVLFSLAGLYFLVRMRT
ncbi:MAG TPA: LptF/LptG family permease [Bryobacteraceae bacterium]|jgi:LPS export ABC transporter permease LptF/LPS export ABC transporter permease LptG|nr:LptF/LptG family permease [Bryobacteraceae bacterium]